MALRLAKSLACIVAPPLNFAVQAAPARPTQFSPTMIVHEKTAVLLGPYKSSALKVGGPRLLPDLGPAKP